MPKYVSRNVCIGFVSVISFILCMWVRFNPIDLSNFGAIMESTISFASFITCLMFIGLAYLPETDSSKAKSVKHAMEDLKITSLILYQIWITITIYFTISIVSLLAMAFSKTSWLNVWLTSFWVALLVGGILEVASLLYELFRLIIYMNKSDDNDD